MNATVISRPRQQVWLVLLLILIVAAAAAAWWLSRAHGRFVEYAMLDPKDIPTMVAVAPDGSGWFTIDFNSAMGRVKDGKLERLAKPTANLEPVGLAVGPDGAAWFTDAPAGVVSRLTPAGELTSFPLQTKVAKLGQIALARDGSLWFAEGNAQSITRLKDGKFERTPIPFVLGGPVGGAVAPDGTVWSTLLAANQVMRIAPDGSTDLFDIPTRRSSPSDIAVDATGAVWFLQFRGNKLGRLADGKFEEFALGEENVGPTGLAIGPDGSVWFGMLREGSIGRFRDGRITRYKLPRERARPYSVAVDARGDVWYTDISGYVGRLTP